MPHIMLRRRALPAPGKMRVQQGDMVRHDTIIAELDYIPGSMQRIEAAKELGISGEFLGEKIMYAINDLVPKGAVLAENMEFQSVKSILSPIDGVVVLWSKYNGSIYMRGMAQQAVDSKPIVLLASDYGLSNADFVADFIPAMAMYSPMGDRVSAHGQLLVMAGQRLFTRMDMVSPFTCHVTVVSREEGRIEMMPLFKNSELFAGMDGVVKDIPEPGVCILASYGYRYVGAVGYGDQGAGTLRYVPCENRTLEASDLSPKDEGCIIVAPWGASLGALHAAADVSVAGMVLGHVDMEILKAFSGQNPLRHTGQLMTLPYPLLLMRGFEGSIAAADCAELANLSGRHCFVDANTQLRAGVTRPELLVPILEDIAMHQESMLKDEELPSARENVQEGDLVLLVREPGFGRYATIVSVNAQLQKTSAGTYAVMAEVCLEDTGETLIVPLANCQRLA